MSRSPRAALLAALCLPPSIEAQRAEIGPSGYLRALTGVHDAGFDVPGFSRTTGFHGEVLRLKWRVALGEALSLVVHNRLDVRVTSDESGFGSVAGFGVSVIPARPVDLSTLLIDEERVTVRHDVDRLALTVRTSPADITVGRQAITWGLASVFPIADLWAQFSPFELDTEEKPGSDALRLLSYPVSRLELDAVLAARGRARDWSAGLRATVDLPTADLYAATGKFWNQVLVMGGMVYVLDRAKLRLEAAAPWDLDADRWQPLRATIGADWLSTRLVLTAEYHHNGIGADDPGDYFTQLGDPRLQRGETYYLGRHYLGGAASYTPDEAARLTFALSALWNLGDGSTMLTPIASYDFGQNTIVSVGSLQSFGRTPVVSPPELRSEFGTYGDLWFTRVSVYF